MHNEVIEAIAMKLLGIIIIDSKLNFEDHNLSLCHEASIQLNALIAFEMYGKKKTWIMIFFVSILSAATHGYQHREKYRNSLHIKEKRAME